MMVADICRGCPHREDCTGLNHQDDCELIRGKSIEDLIDIVNAVTEERNYWRAKCAEALHIECYLPEGACVE